jgi:hypothetical protein
VDSALSQRYVLFVVVVPNVCCVGRIVSASITSSQTTILVRASRRFIYYVMSTHTATLGSSGKRILNGLGDSICQRPSHE